MIKVLINTQQKQYEDALGDTTAIEDIADTLEGEKPLYDDQENNNQRQQTEDIKDELDTWKEELKRYKQQVHENDILDTQTGYRSEKFNFLVDQLR